MSTATRTEILPGSQRPQPSPAIPGPPPRSIITRDGERALSAELDRLRHELTVEFAARLREAREFGEAASNDEYLQIKEEEAVLSSGIARLESLLASATVVGDADPARGVVAIGTIVEVENRDSGSVTEHLLTGGYERLIPKAASADSPVGRALMGRVAGDEVEVELPGDRQRRLRIVAVRHPSRK